MTVYDSKINWWLIPVIATLCSAVITQAKPTQEIAKIASDIQKVDFLNYSYQPSVCSDEIGIPKTVKVHEGKFKDGDNFYTIAATEMSYGDVNGDGREDAVIQVRCGSSAGTLRAFEIHVYTDRNGKAELLATLDSLGVEADYKKTNPEGTVFFPSQNAPKIVNGHLMIEALTDGSFASPENMTTFDYRWNGDKFILCETPTQTQRKV